MPLKVGWEIHERVSLYAPLCLLLHAFLFRSMLPRVLERGKEKRYRYFAHEFTQHRLYLLHKVCTLPRTEIPAQPWSRFVWPRCRLQMARRNEGQI